MTPIQFYDVGLVQYHSPLTFKSTAAFHTSKIEEYLNSLVDSDQISVKGLEREFIYQIFLNGGDRGIARFQYWSKAVTSEIAPISSVYNWYALLPLEIRDSLAALYSGGNKGEYFI